MEDILPIRIAFSKYRSQYDKGDADYSVSEVIRPPRITILSQRHQEEIRAKPLDINALLESFDGTATHRMFEGLLQDEPDFILERRLFVELFGRRVSGCPDMIHVPTRTLYDYKKTSVWKAILGDTSHWCEQLNTYAHLIRVNLGLDIGQIFVLAWWKDFAERDRELSGDRRYPASKIEQIAIPLWSPEDQEQFLRRRVYDLVIAESFPDNLLPECTPEDMWIRGGGWAVMPYTGGRRGRRAARILATREEAEQWMTDNAQMRPKGVRWKLEARRGFRARCENWCVVNEWCSQYAEYVGGGQL